MVSIITAIGLTMGGVLVLACSRQSQTEPAGAEPLGSSVSAAHVAPATLASARLGAPAPDFQLPDLDDKLVKLSTFRGKTVVLEWFNPGCPFVTASHTKGSLIDTAARHEKNGVVWLAINSGAKGRQGHGVEANREGKRLFNLTHPILLDETGAVGRAYGAAHTPHMYVVDPKGVLVYRGAIDNSPDGEGDSPTGGKLVNHVDAAVAAVAAGKPVATPETKAYGCSVKYDM
jgi:peroxiredoxin